LEQRQAGPGAVQRVVDEAPRGEAGLARHAGSIRLSPSPIKQKELRPLFFPLFSTPRIAE
jgi:hypothetical protein